MNLAISLHKISILTVGFQAKHRACYMFDGALFFQEFK